MGGWDAEGGEEGTGEVVSRGGRFDGFAMKEYSEVWVGMLGNVEIGRCEVFSRMRR